MKALYILISFLFFGYYGQAQVKKDSVSAVNKTADDEADDETDDADKIFSFVEVEAQFPGGDAGWVTYLQKNLDPEVPIRKRAKRGTYPVVIGFVVNKDGMISDIKAETNFGKGMEAEAIRVIKNGPKWLPAMQNGKAVNAYRRQPITFVID